ncbi:MAG: DUF2099 family protein [Candidatus Omnitrophica bacterium]|nr:DUF2099 family protein [Candidatus Omnitrophota bacterium]MBU1128349.1 DUF2099 family protein [Candidatus Omnitrophota bacterium]MBU1784769.1 DUF2099 family protein [Candidatus Omnitrophota bacterium]MBU1851848.1 DUF2099 family protein [Candidatus Omnitrophota bacterium]
MRIHVLRFYSSYVTVINGKAVEATEPVMTYCPLADHFYKGIRDLGDKKKNKWDIIKAVNEKISKFGYFTENRILFDEQIAVPYGASEIIMFAMKKGIIDAGVIVCDGAGTVIVENPALVQGIGARMNGLFYTSPIERTIERLEDAGCKVLSPKALIKQIEGVELAAKLGHKTIVVTVNATTGERLREFRRIENKYNVSVISLVICTTGVTGKRIEEIGKDADIVWSCASEEIREKIGKKAILQLSEKIPVFVLTAKGLDLVDSYSDKENVIKTLNTKRQYLVVSRGEGQKFKMGNFRCFLREAILPVRDKKEPKLAY